MNVPAGSETGAAVRAPRWRDQAVLAAIAGILRADHSAMGPLDRGRLEDGLAGARSMMIRGAADPFALAASYACGIAKARPLDPGSGALALAAVIVALGLRGFRLAAEEVETAATFRDLERDAVGFEDLKAWLAAASVPRGGG